MRRPLHLLLLGLVCSVAGCVIIINPTIDANQPVPVPLLCNPASDAPKAHVIFATRIERSTVNLAERYGVIMQDVVLGMAAVGIEVTTGALIRIDERPVEQPILAAWGCNLDSPEELLPADVIRFYAQQTQRDEEASECPIQPLTSLGSNLTEAVTQYPQGLNGRSGLSVFGSAPELVLVVYLDSAGRKVGFTDPGCAQSRDTLQTEGIEGGAGWLDYPGPDVPHQNVVHWFFTTEEQIPRETFVANCKMVDGFPSSMLDILEESRLPFYGPLSQDVSGRGESIASLSLCKALVESEEKKFLRSEIESLAGILGLSVDEERLKDVLNGGLGELLGPEEGTEDVPVGGLRGDLGG